MLDDLISRIKRLNESADAAPVDVVLATPEWTKEHQFETIRGLLLSDAIHITQKGPTVIPAVARELKAVGVDLQVTRDGQQPLSIVAYTGFGNIVVWWDREALVYWMEIHSVVHPAVVEDQVQFNSNLSVPRREPVFVEQRGFFDKLGEAFANLFRK